MESKQNLTAFVFGYTGGAGRSIVNALALEPRYSSVTLFGRRVVELDKDSKTGAKLTGDFSKFKQEVLDFDKLSEYGDKLKGFDAGFYSLGVSPFDVDAETFKKVVIGYTTTVAKMAVAGGVKRFNWMSGALANKGSLMAGSRIVGELEEQMSAIEGFEKLSIYRPAVILSNENSGGMVGGKSVSVVRAVDRLHWFSVESELLGKFVVANSLAEGKPGKVERLENKEINAWGKQQGHSSSSVPVYGGG